MDCEALELPFMKYETWTGLKKRSLNVRDMIYWPFSLLMRGSKYRSKLFHWEAGDMRADVRSDADGQICRSGNKLHRSVETKTSSYINWQISPSNSKR